MVSMDMAFYQAMTVRLQDGLALFFSCGALKILFKDSRVIKSA